MPIRKGPTVVEVRPTDDPVGRRAVLVQLEHGWVTLTPRDAYLVAAMIVDVADEIEREEAPPVTEPDRATSFACEAPTYEGANPCPACVTVGHCQNREEAP